MLLPALLLPLLLAQSPSAPADARWDQEARRFLAAYRTHEAMVSPMLPTLRELRKQAPERAAQLECLVAKVRSGQLDGPIIQVVKRYLTLEQMRTISDFLEGPTGRKMLDQMMGQVQANAEAGTNRAPDTSKLQFTPQEQEELRRLDEQPAFKAFNTFVESGLRDLGQDPALKAAVAEARKDCEGKR